MPHWGRTSPATHNSYQGVASVGVFGDVSVTAGLFSGWQFLRNIDKEYYKKDSTDQYTRSKARKGFDELEKRRGQESAEPDESAP